MRNKVGLFAIASVALVATIPHISAVSNSPNDEMRGNSFMTGRWEVTVKPRHVPLCNSILFRTCEKRTALQIPHKQASKQDERIIKCILSLEENGIFDIKSVGADNCHDHIPQIPDQRNVTGVSTPESDGLARMAIQGKWIFRPNPYCITDRFYDELSLLSHPRARIWRCKKNPKDKLEADGVTNIGAGILSKNHDKGFVVERARIEFKCKVWGRYGYGANDRGRSRLTHGTILAVRSGSKAVMPAPKWCWWRRKILLATFQARAILSESEASQYEEEQIGLWVFHNGKWSISLPNP